MVQTWLGAVVRNGAAPGCFQWWRRRPAPHPIVAREDIEDGAARRPHPPRIARLEPLEDLPCAPAKAGVLAEDQGDDVGGGLPRRGPGGPTLVLQAGDPQGAVALQPFVAGVATDAVASAEFGHGPLAAVDVVGEVMAFEHGIGLLPGHGGSSHRVWKKCHPCPRTSVTHVPLLYLGAC